MIPAHARPDGIAGLVTPVRAPEALSFPIQIVRSRDARRDLVRSVLSGAAAGVLVVVQAVLVAKTVDAVFLRGATSAAVLTWIAAAAGAAFARAVLTYCAEVLAGRAAVQTKAALRAGLAAALVRRPSSGTEHLPSGELVNTAMAGVESVHAYVGQYLPQLALAILVPLVVVSAVAALDPLSAGVLIVTGPLIPFFMYLIAGVARAQTRRQWRTLAQMSARFLEALQGMVTLVAFGRSREEVAQIARASAQFRVATLSVLRVAFTSALALELLATISTAIIAVQVGLRLLYARIAFADALAVLLLAPEFYRPLRTLGAAFHAGMSGREAGADVLARLGEAEPAVPHGTTGPPRAAGAAAGGDSAAAPDRPVVLGAAPPALQFERVTHQDPARAEPALDRVSFEVRPGETVALVGPSGAGKSTIARLLLRFVVPQDGTILVDGQPLESIDVDEWRARIAWVPQRSHLFHGTIEENVRLGRPAASAAEVRDALARAGAEPFVRELPLGAETIVGERGARLSGGQAQRVALARAFLRDTPLLILDEPTAELDPEHEQLIAGAVRAARRGRTVLLIAHRLTTVADADQIVVLDRGRLVEQGTHAQLIAAQGTYARQLAAWGGLA